MCQCWLLLPKLTKYCQHIVNVESERADQGHASDLRYGIGRDGNRRDHRRDSSAEPGGLR